MATTAAPQRPPYPPKAKARFWLFPNKSNKPKREINPHARAARSSGQAGRLIHSTGKNMSKAWPNRVVLLKTKQNYQVVLFLNKQVGLGRPKERWYFIFK